MLIIMMMLPMIIMMQGVQREEGWGECGVRDHAGRAGGG